MKIVISSKGKTLESEVDPRFGRCQYFMVVDTETIDFEVISNENATASGGAGIQAAQTISKTGAEFVFTGNVGPNAFQTLTAAGIKIFTGVSGTIRDVIKKYKNGEFEEIQDPTVGGHYGMKNNNEPTEERKSQKVCVPSVDESGLDSMVGEHFGRVSSYTIVDLDTDEVKIIPNNSHHMGGHGYPPEIMKREGVNVMICSGLGSRAIEMFEEFGIDVYIGAFGTVKDAVAAFRQGTLQKASEGGACKEHVFGDRHSS